MTIHTNNYGTRSQDYKTSFMANSTEHEIYHAHKRTATCDFKQCGILTSVVSDEPGQPPFKLRNSKLCSGNSFTVKEYSSD